MKGIGHNTHQYRNVRALGGVLNMTLSFGDSFCP